MSFMWNVVYVIIALVVVKISQWLWQWSNPNSKGSGKLPPGSMGFPIVGETFEFFRSSGLLEIPPFFQKRMLRYGPLFRTNILGSRTVISTDADVIYEIFRQENQSFIQSYPDIFVKVLGKDNVFFKTGDIHRHIKHATMHLIGSEGLKRKMIGFMNQTTREHLRWKATQGAFNLRHAASNLIVSYITPQMISNLKPETQEKLIDHFKTFNIEWFQSPFALATWKTVYKVLRARKEAVKIITEALEKRKDSIEKQGDFLDTLLEEMKKEGSIFYKESIVSLLLNIGFVSRDSTSYATALTVNFISKNPRVLTELKREHEAIVQKRDDKEPGLGWDEYKNCMPFTRMVIYESLRLANLGTIIFRKAVKDVEVKGYTIPAGWIVAVAPSVVHYNSEIYENPLEFNPWRWEGKDLQSPGSKTLMVFGGGARQCIGSDLARLHLAVFIHHFVTTYDFSVVQECEICRVPFPFFTKDLVINISPKSPS
ncbi:cytochrome P450 708A2 [Brassica rapa]|uniref:cytochrome P450 708A2 n=1 Tax=Brassica campestris TaxID=3711 RepID=UPI0004F16D26|nr:cytochrome P450 708A2 [Brassica rapa]